MTYKKGDFVKLVVDLEYSRQTKGNIVQVYEKKGANKFQVCLNPFKINCEEKKRTLITVNENKLVPINKRDEQKICVLLQGNVNYMETLLKEQKELLALMLQKLYN